MSCFLFVPLQHTWNSWMVSGFEGTARLPCTLGGYVKDAQKMITDATTANEGQDKQPQEEGGAAETKKE